MVKCCCGTCGKVFEKYPSQVAKFCSRACAAVAKRQHVGAFAGHWQGGQVACTCLTCGKTFYVDPNRVTAGRGKHCSKECYWQRVRGPKHWNYRHGRGRFPYTGGFTKSVREKVIARDKVCTNCGVWDDRPRRMQVHHLDGGHDDHSLDNLALLCSKCHGSRHQGVSNSIGNNTSRVPSSASAMAC